jgi:hypothetical protein
MRWLIGLAVGGVLGLGCGKTVYRSYEGHFCSSTENDDPFFECSPTYDLVCIHTYDQQVQTMGGQPPKYLPIYLCRLACAEGDHCPDPQDVCCKGEIHGRDYGKIRACVPAGQCQTEEAPDAGKADKPRDTAPEIDGPESQESTDGPASPDGGTAG